MKGRGWNLKFLKVLPGGFLEAQQGSEVWVLTRNTHAYWSNFKRTKIQMTFLPPCIYHQNDL